MNYPTVTLTLDAAWIGSGLIDVEYQPLSMSYAGRVLLQRDIDGLNRDDAEYFDSHWREMMAKAWREMMEAERARPLTLERLRRIAKNHPPADSWYEEATPYVGLESLAEYRKRNAVDVKKLMDELGAK